MKVTAFGYRAYVSRSYDVPPPVTGLKLKLRRDPAQQRYLIDPNGRVGTVALAGKPRRVSGLRIRAVHQRVRAITVLSKRFRTESGIRLGSLQADVNHAYPQAALKALKRKVKAKVLTYRVGRATLRVRGGRVVGIVLDRA